MNQKISNVAIVAISFLILKLFLMIDNFLFPFVVMTKKEEVYVSIVFVTTLIAKIKMFQFIVKNGKDIFC